MSYDLIILGATFAAAGMLAAAGERALVLEPRPDAGYEFIGALARARIPAPTLQSPQAQSLQAAFAARGVYERHGGDLAAAAPAFYAALTDKHVLLETEILSCEHGEEGWCVLAHGVNGYRRFHASRVVDTRLPEELIREKSLAMRILTPEGERPVHLPVPPQADVLAARAAQRAYLQDLPADCRLLLTAECFTVHAAAPCPEEREDGIRLLPSALFDDPLLAYDAGVRLGGELCK